MSEEYNYSSNAQKVKKILGSLSIIILLIILGIYFSTGIYQINPSEVGLVKRFGKYVRTAGPGINYHLPAPFESVTVVDILSLRKIEIGFRTSTTPGRYSATLTEESLMMTGDNNFASVESAVQYRIKDPVQYAFKIANPDEVVKLVAESVIRERVAQRTIDQVLTSDRDQIAIEAKQTIQEILDAYESGVVIDNVRLQEVYPPSQVLAAFDDVNSANQDMEKTINTALKYYNDVVPRAEGEASRTVQEAEAYKEVQILKAEGEVTRFLQILERYEKAPEITKQRLYIEMMENILPDSKKLMLLNKNNDTFNFLDIQEVMKGGDLK